MIRRLIIPVLILVTIPPVTVLPQGKSVFSGERDKFSGELVAFMGPNLNNVQESTLSTFVSAWDSTGYNKDNQAQIMDLAGKLETRNMRPVPHFNNLLATLNDFIRYENDPSFLNNWLKGAIRMASKETISNERLDLNFRNTSLLIKSKIIHDSGTARWIVKNENLRFRFDTVFSILMNNVTLTCRLQKDSTEIYNVTGVYYPEFLEFRGSKGTVTWEKAGFSKNDVFAEMYDYRIDITRNSFDCDSAKLTHKTFFKVPVYGSLSDRITSTTNKDKVAFPVFVTSIKKFKIEDLYEGVSFEGGLRLEGSGTIGTGENSLPAEIKLYRNDTLYVKVNSKEFLFTKNGFTSQESSAYLYLGNDSIFHSNLGFSYNAANRQVNLFRTSIPISKSPYFDSYHNMDLYFEYFSWNMNDPKAVLSRPKGASIGQAMFESSSFFNENYFMKLMGLDDYHPLNRLKLFSEWYYSETFPIKEFAKWLKRSEEAVVGLCIDLANRGFLFYNRITNEVTIKKKVYEFLDAYSKKKDYDVISFVSETTSPTDNAVLDFRNFRLDVNGVQNVFLSDSQNVVFFPYNNQLAIGKNRSINFNGVVVAGLYTIFGRDFDFSYDTFKIHLQNIDSIKIAVETEKKDAYGRPVISEIRNLIQLGTAELYIDDPNNKSGRRSLKKYPIINATSNSYIFYDKIPELEGIYKKDDFYFKVDPFTYENIDHYAARDVNLAGEFYGGNIIDPVRQYLTIQKDSSLGFTMKIPAEGLDIYGKKGRFYDIMSMSDLGFIGSGTLKRLTSTTQSDDYRFFPDSMITHATTFDMAKDTSGLFPELKSQDVKIKWLTEKDEWHAVNSKGKSFDMFSNGTSLDGSIVLSPAQMRGSGTINTVDSRITAEHYKFGSSTIQSDTADYNLKSLKTSGYAFTAENVNLDVNFGTKMTNFRLNTDSSVVKLPEVQYICKMTDFTYNMANRTLAMEQKGKSSAPLLTPQELIRLDFKQLDKPTFFSTNNMRDTIAFTSWKGTYNLDNEYIEAENINYLHIADALIQPDSGKIIINRQARIRPLQNAVIAVNNRHILHSASIDIENSKRYGGNAVYDYTDENNDKQQIKFPEITVDTATTTAKGFIPESQKFMLSPAFSFAGDVALSAREDLLLLTGAAGIAHTCRNLNSSNIKFKSRIDPKNVMIPVPEKPRDMNDNLVFSGSFINLDSSKIYPAFLSPQKSYSDVALISADGYLYFEKEKGRYLITSREKLADRSLNGNMVSFDKNFCIMSGEGTLNFGANFDHMKMKSAGTVVQNIDSGKVEIKSLIALDFHFSPEALEIMSSEIRGVPSLKPQNLNTEFYKKGIKDLLGAGIADQMKQELDLFGTSRNMPKEFVYELLLSEVDLYWNSSTSSFRSHGKIGIGFVGAQPINVYVDGYVEIQRRRSGDMIDIYLKTDAATWYYFSYFRGVLMAQANNGTFNTILSTTKQKERKHPDATVRKPYTYMIAVEDRLGKFLQRMTTDMVEDSSSNR
jgi:hypothetical protein